MKFQFILSVYIVIFELIFSYKIKILEHSVTLYTYYIS